MSEPDKYHQSILTDEDLAHIVETVNRQGLRISDGDIERMAQALEKKIVSRFYSNLGKGIFGLAWRGIILVCLFLAAYGYFGKKFW